MNEAPAKIAIRIRPAQAEDVNFIFNSWLKSFRNGLICKDVENTIYFNEHHKLIEKLVKRGTTRVACVADDPANIVGWACYEKIAGILAFHFAYTKHIYRGLGVLRQIMLELNQNHNLASLYTHQTSLGKKLSHKYNMIYHPYILMNYDKQEVVVEKESK